MSKNALHTFMDTLTRSLSDGTFVRLTLAAYKGEDKTLKRIIAVRTLIKGQENLSFTYRHETRDITKNAPIPQALETINTALQNGFNAATVFTTEFDYTFPHLKKSKPIHKNAPNLSHNRIKNYAVQPSAPYLHALGLASASGNIHAQSQDKFRQINKFIEILATLTADIQNPKVIDMGAGKGYLTFALYDYLTRMGKSPQMRAVEYRDDLVTLCNDIAFACDFNNLKFEQGTIENADMQDANILIALHACDTATDDALAKAIKSNCELIVVAPCCHKQIRRDTPKPAKDHPMHAVLQHGIYTERLCEMLTDTMRALILESYGYKVKVFEFIDSTHTAKNIMITATKSGKPNPQATQKLAQLMAHYNIPHHYLQTALSQ